METSTKSGKGAGGRKGESKKKPVTKSVKAGLQFPVGRLARYLKNGRYAKRVGIGTPIFLAAVLEYLAPEGTWLAVVPFYLGLSPWIAWELFVVAVCLRSAARDTV